jgi:peptidyl-prolyl cis-trans isomerase SurA
VLAVLVIGLASCKGAPPVLPPVPPGSGQVLVASGPPPDVRDGQIVVDRVAAVVNDEVIMVSELDEAVLLSQDGKSGMPDGGVDEIRRRMLTRLIEVRLLVQEARREKVEVSEEEIQALFDDFVKRQGGDRDEVLARAQARGETWELLRRDLRDQLLVQRLRGRRVNRRATVTEAEVDAYMAANRAKLETGLKYHVRHIVVLAQPPDPAGWEGARVEIEDLARQIRAGADFASLARERSKDPSAASGGDLGWLARGELEPIFEAPLLALSPGGVTAPIRSGAGYHLFQLVEQEALTEQMLAEGRQQARELLAQRKAQERFDEWLAGIRRRALIAIRL